MDRIPKATQGKGNIDSKNRYHGGITLFDLVATDSPSQKSPSGR